MQYWLMKSEPDVCSNKYNIYLREMFDNLSLKTNK